MTFLKTSETQLKGLIKPSTPYLAILVDEMMRNESTLTECRLGGCLGYTIMKDDDVSAFAASLEQNTTLQILRLGEFVLFFCLGGVWVTQVRLRGSSLSGIGCFWFNSPCQSDCNIGDTAAAALAAAVEKNSTLLQLKLNGVLVVSCVVEAGYGLLLF